MVEAGKLVVGIIVEEGSDDPPHGNNKNRSEYRDWHIFDIDELL